MGASDQEVEVGLGTEVGFQDLIPFLLVLKLHGNCFNH